MKRPLIVIGSDPTPFQWFKLLPTLAKHPNARFILEPGASLYGWDLEDSKMIKRDSKMIQRDSKMIQIDSKMIQIGSNSFKTDSNRFKYVQK